MDSDSYSSSRSSSISGSLVSQQSGRYLRKPRRNVGDRVLITSSSNVYLNRSSSESDLPPPPLPPRRKNYEGRNCDKVDYEMVSESIRNSKDLPKVRSTIIEDNLESQEVTFYIDDYNSDPNAQNESDSFDSFDSDSDVETSEENKVELRHKVEEPPLPEPPPESNSLVKFAENVKKIKKTLSRDLTKSLRRISRRIVQIDSDAKGSAPVNGCPSEGREESPVPAIPKQPAVEPIPTMTTTEEEQKPAGLLTRIRRSISLSADAALIFTSKFENQRRSTFYLTDPIDIDASNDDSNENSLECVNDFVVVPKITSSVPGQSRLKLVRPKSPPPPAPIQNQVKRDPSKEIRCKSLYAEAGVFKTNGYRIQQNERMSWYTESGLYSNSGSPTEGKPIGKKPSFASVIDELNAKLNGNISASNSEEYNSMESESTYNNQSVRSFNSTSSKADESSLDTDQDLEFFQDEPLYQFYDAAVLELQSVCSDDDASSDFEVDIYEDVEETNDDYISTSDLGLSKTETILSRSLWCEIPEVKGSVVLSQLSSQQKKLQEAKFEVITSEASYLNSLNLLNSHFYSKFKRSNIVNEKEVEKLFGNIKEVRNCSKKILADLEKCWKSNILLDGICEVIQKHAEDTFDVYIPYCENQVLLNDTLTHMKERPGFADFLYKLETSNSCHCLTLYSFLMLPMQRITRWPLLVDAILRRLSETDPEYLTCQHALTTLNKIVSQCNEAARKKEREVELLKISKMLDFSKDVSHINIISPKRWLVKSGMVTQLQPRSDDGRMTFGKKWNKNPMHLFLFNDMFMVTKKKSDNVLTVLHYCSKNFIELRTVDTFPMFFKNDLRDKHVIYLSILENQDAKTVELLLSTASETDKERWLEAFAPPKSENPDETLYECWDCPQVSVLHNYVARQPDELSLSRGDFINVLRKMSDGWYHGERIRDGETGWFPANHTTEIINRHVRSRNLKQRYRLLMYSEQHHLKS